MKYIPLSFNALQEQRVLLEQWAREQDRSISAVLRRLIEQEEQRRDNRPEAQKQLKKAA